MDDCQVERIGEIRKWTGEYARRYERWCQIFIIVNREDRRGYDYFDQCHYVETIWTCSSTVGVLFYVDEYDMKKGTILVAEF